MNERDIGGFLAGNTNFVFLQCKNGPGLTFVKSASRLMILSLVDSCRRAKMLQIRPNPFFEEFGNYRGRYLMHCVHYILVFSSSSEGRALWFSRI